MRSISNPITALLTRRGLLTAAGSVVAFTPASRLVAQAASGDKWPKRTVTIVVPFAAGGPTDVVARVLAEKLAPRLGQSVIVENRAGAGGDLGGTVVARAAPDGHTILMSTTGSLTINRHLRRNPDYDPMRDLIPVSLTFRSDHAVVVARSLPVRNLAEMIALLKREPEVYAYGSAGVGATSHMIAALFSARAGVKMRHIPYRGAGPALNDLIAGHIHVMVDSLANSLPQIEAGTIKVLAVTGEKRHPALPLVPTVAESGFSGFSAFAWGALLVPRGTPESIADRLSREVQAIYAEPATRERLAKVGADTAATTPVETVRFMQNDTNIWEKIIADHDIKAN